MVQDDFRAALERTMDIVTLSRIQFGVTTAFHFLFVPLTLGLVWFVAIFQTLGVAKVVG
jgi:cytochrome bd ubiquinol oxidase subunit I